MGMSTNSLPIRPSVEPVGRLEVERYVSRAELAAIMGVSIATVDRMVAEGMPSVTWGRRTRRFRPSAAISWASERGRAAA
jgi:phage terminase Nu1 subunit (DNA packaging protein)